jgi:hypothetical protein
MALEKRSTPAQRQGDRLLTVAADFARHPDNALFLLVLAACLGKLSIDGWSWVDLVWFGLGWFAFLPQEWLTHIFVLHWVCPRNERIYRWMYRLHYGHHDMPNRHDLMYMPLWLTLPMTVVNLAMFVLLAPSLHAALVMFSGALMGYLMFEWSHLICHVPLRVSGVWARIRARHHTHHFVDEHRGFSVSPPAQWIDRVTGLALEPSRDAIRSPLCRTILPDLDPSWLERARERFRSRSSGDLYRSRLWLIEDMGKHGQRVG